MAEAAHQQQGMIQTVETVYARALLELAKDAGVLDEIAGADGRHRGARR